MRQVYAASIVDATADSTALTASTTPTTILHPTMKFPFRGNSLRLGDRLVIEAHGRVTNVVTTPGTLTLEVRMGPASAIAVASGVAALNVVAKTNVPWWLTWVLELRAAGAGTNANFMHQGKWESESVVGAVAGSASIAMLPAATPGVGTGFDSTGENILELFGTWSLNNANSIQTHGWRVFHEN
jgi:hypothetical protein